MAGEAGRLTVQLVTLTDWKTPDGKELLGHLCRGFANLPNVAEVRSLTQPIGAPIKASPPEISGNSLLSGLLKTVRRNIDDALEQANRAAREFYCATLPPEKDRQRDKETRRKGEHAPDSTVSWQLGQSYSNPRNPGLPASPSPGLPVSSSRGPRFVTRLDVVLGSDPFDQASTETLKLIPLWLSHDRPR